MGADTKSRPGPIVSGAVIGAVITVPAIVLAVLSGGAGHGSYFFAKLLFPFAMLITPLTSNVIAVPSIIVALLQLPVEGALIGFAHRSRRPILAVAVVVAHLVAFGFCSFLSSFT